MVSKQGSGTSQHVTAIIVYKPQMQQVNLQHDSVMKYMIYQLVTCNICNTVSHVHIV